MLQLWTIALVGIMAVWEALPGSGAAAAFSWWSVLAALAPFLAIIIMVQLVCRASSRALDHRGDYRAIGWADRTVQLSQPLAVASHAVAVLGLGLIGQIRAAVPGVPLVDHAIAMLPPLAVFVSNWWAMYPIERRLSDASMVRALDDGQAVYAPPTRWQFVVARVRHDLLLILVPLVLISLWARGVEWSVRSEVLAGLWPALREQGNRELAQAGGQLLGVAMVLALAPAVMRRVWDTVRLGEGELREELLSLCRGAGVKVREILVWRTHHVVVNGAAMGLIPRFRYILLTDALLEKLPRRQLHAVMAHEIGHVKHRHIPWLILGVIASSGLITSVAMLGLWAADRLLGLVVPGFSAANAEPRAWELWWFGATNLVAGAIGLAAALGVFGLISRRFEWQADAFAVQRLSAEQGTGLVSPEAVAAMQGALQTVADLSHMPVARGSFRHGSILTRQRRLQRLIGTSVERAPIDRVSRGIKVATAVGLAVVIAMSVVDAATPKAHDQQAGGSGGAASVEASE